MAAHMVLLVDGRALAVRGWRAGDRLRELGLRPIFAAGGWIVDSRYLADVTAYLDHRHIAYRVVYQGQADAS